MTRQRRIAVLSGLFLLSSVALAHSIRAQNAPPKKPPQPVMDQMTNIPYFTLQDGMSSRLTLNNIGPTATPVIVTIYNMEGKAHVLDPITLIPHSYKQIDLGTVVPSDEFSAGNIQIAYTGIDMGLTSQVSVFSLDKRVSFESREPYEMQDMQDMMPFMSTNLAGILSLPQREAQGFLALTNSGANRDTVQVSVGSKQKAVTLQPRQTRLLRLNDDFDQPGPRASLLKLQYNGLPGDIITTGFVLDLKNGYSSAFAMFDPALDRSSHVAGAHLRIGQPDPAEGFPDGTQFHSPLLLGNLGNKPVTAHVLLDYTIRQKLEMAPTDPTQADAAEDKFNTIPVADVSIPAGGVQRVELSDVVAKLGEGTILEAGVDVNYEAAPGTLLGNLVSVDQTGDYSFEVPVKDPAAMTEGTGGIYPWTLEGGTNTVIHLKNTTNKSVTGFVLFDYYDNGAVKTYNPPPITLQPYQTVVIDIQKFKDSKKQDVRGQVFSAHAMNGQAQWRQEQPHTMIGRAEETDVKGGIARSFSCNYYCCVNYAQDEFLSPDPLTGPVGQWGVLTAYYEGIDCNGFAFGPYTDSANSWSSDNINVATVSTNSSYDETVNYVSLGTANVSAQAHDIYYQSDFPCTCSYYTDYQPVGSQVNVMLDITGKSYIFVGTDPNLVIANSFFATVSPTGGTLTGSSSDSKDTFTPVQSGGPGLYVTTTDQSQSNSDRTLTFTYTVNGRSAQQVLSVTARQFAYATNNNPSNACGLGYGYSYSYVYTPWTHPDHTAVAPGIGISGTAVTENLNPSTIACGNETGNGALTQNSEFIDMITFCSNAPLPTCSSTNTQTLSVAGYPVRTNTLTIANTGLTYTSQGPTQ